ncbi:hypothetical protein Leryth_011767 [Lithospermum erythrorhizon]|nr:hypothetical protein Leryth_011767 [Lithospermum erythrorhizon]
MDKSDVEMRGATEQSEDPNNGEVHPQNGSVDVQPLNNDDRLPHSATVQDTKPSELGTQENLDGVTESKDEVVAAKNTESELESPNSKDTANGLEMTSENVDQDRQPGEKTVEDPNIKEDSEVENTPVEKVAVPAELTVEKASHNETGVIEEMKGSKDETSDGEVLASGNEGTVNEPKQSEKMAVPTSSLEDGVTEEAKFPEAEREENDADHNSTEAMVDAPKDNVKDDVQATAAAYTNAILGTLLVDQNPTTPPSIIKCPSTKSGGQNEESYRNMFNEINMTGDEDGTPEEQVAFMRVVESFYRARSMEFKPPKFYGQQLNCLKLWRSVIKLGGYDRVTGSKLWRQVGESFHPPKTCTTISWTFRIFYEKALLEYEKHVTESGELQLPVFAASDPSSVDNEGSMFQASGSGRARRDSATRAMQGWHSRLLGNSEGGEQIMKDKNGNNMKREKTIKSIGISLYSTLDFF